MQEKNSTTAFVWLVCIPLAKRVLKPTEEWRLLSIVYFLCLPCLFIRTKMFFEFWNKPSRPLSPLLWNCSSTIHSMMKLSHKFVIDLFINIHNRIHVYLKVNVLSSTTIIHTSRFVFPPDETYRVLFLWLVLEIASSLKTWLLPQGRYEE